MKNGIINRITFYYLSWRWIVTGVLVVIGVGLILLSRAGVGCVAILLATLVFTAHYGIQINTVEKKYFDYFSILGFKMGEQNTYQKIDYVFLKSGSRHQTMNSMVTSRTLTDDVFDGYIKFDGNNKIYLLSNTSKKKIARVLDPLADALQVSVVDYTREETPL